MTGRFTYEEATGRISGPTGYMRQRYGERMQQIYAGRDQDFNKALPFRTDEPVALALDLLEADYREWVRIHHGWSLYDSIVRESESGESEKTVETATYFGIMDRGNEYGYHVIQVQGLAHIDATLDARYFDTAWLAASFRRYREAVADMKRRNRLRRDCSCSLSSLRQIHFQIRYPIERRLRRMGFIAWECEPCGRRYTCECFRGMMEAQSESGWETAIPGYLTDKRIGWGESPQRAAWLKKSLPTERPGELQRESRRCRQRIQYCDGICHLCHGITPEPFSVNRSDSSVTELYRPYIMAEALRSSVDVREAENRVRERLGIPRIGEGWVSETQLYNQVRTLFPRLRVEREASPEWLGRMRFDIFLSAVGVAVEYQGEQHYRPVELFGGEEGFARTRERDLEKHRLAREAGVEIVEFRHDEVLTDEDVRERIASAIESACAQRRA